LAGLTRATLTITGGNLSPSVSPISAAISVKGIGSAPGVTGFAFSISPATGLYTGKFLDGMKVSRSFTGVLLPAHGMIGAAGFGLFKGNPYTGKTNTPPGVTGSVEL
jgi:hypothetical protein